MMECQSNSVQSLIPDREVSANRDIKKVTIKMNEPPAARLNNMMAKLGIKPSYELIVNDLQFGIDKFMWRLTCPVSPCGIPFTVEGRPARTKKEAKHNAAKLFMKKFIKDDEAKRRKAASKYASSSILEAAIMCSEGRDMLEDICSKNKLGRPEYTDLMRMGSSRYFQIECKLGNLLTQGKGKNKIEARLHATARMMQVLMETVSIRDLLDSEQLTVISHKMPGIVCYNENEQQVEPSIKQEMESDSGSNQIQLEAFGNSELRTRNVESSRGMWLDDNRSECANGAVASSNGSTVIEKDLTRLQAVSRIDRTLGSSEKQLYDKILDAILYSDGPYCYTVSVLCHDYQVTIRHNESPQILEGGSECCDQSIRVACLTKLLLNLKEHIATNSIRSQIKSEQE